MFPNGRSVETPAAMPAADPDRRAGAGSAPAAIMPGAGHGTWAVPFDTDPSPARQAGQRPLNIRPGRHRGPPPPADRSGSRSPILDALAKAGVAFVALKENIRVEGKSNIQTKVMTTLFALFAEVERDLYLRAHPRGLALGQVLGPEARRPERAPWASSRLDGKEDRNPALHRAGSSRALTVYFCTNLVGTLTWFRRGAVLGVGGRAVCAVERRAADCWKGWSDGNRSPRRRFRSQEPAPRCTDAETPSAPARASPGPGGQLERARGPGPRGPLAAALAAERGEGPIIRVR